MRRLIGQKCGTLSSWKVMVCCDNHGIIDAYHVGWWNGGINAELKVMEPYSQDVTGRDVTAFLVST
jgi:hypothetical protein